MGWSCSGVSPSSVVVRRRPQFQRSSPLKPRGQMHVEWGTKVEINGPGHMTKMTAMAINNLLT